MVVEPSWGVLLRQRSSMEHFNQRRGSRNVVWVNMEWMGHATLQVYADKKVKDLVAVAVAG